MEPSDRQSKQATITRKPKKRMERRRWKFVGRDGLDYRWERVMPGNLVEVAWVNVSQFWKRAQMERMLRCACGASSCTVAFGIETFPAQDLAMISTMEDGEVKESSPVKLTDLKKALEN